MITLNKTQQPESKEKTIHPYTTRFKDDIETALKKLYNPWIWFAIFAVVVAVYGVPFVVALLILN